MGDGTRRGRRPVRHVATAGLVVAVLLLAGCGDDGDDVSAGSTTTAGASSTTAGSSSTTAPAAEPLQILVSNDDGYAAKGIDTLVVGLQTLPDVEITVVAPKDQRSGTGGKRTDGKVAVEDVELASGFAAKAVDGFPTDAVRVAMDELGVKPDLVVAGINEGQNLGPALDISGTVGAARAAVARGVPALSVSSGTTSFDYAAAVPFVLDWITEHRAALADGSLADVVANLNVPSCSAGKVRGLEEVEADPAADLIRSIGAQDCTSTDPVDPEAGDVEAFLDGYATLSEVPAEPQKPAEVVPAGT